MSAQEGTGVTHAVMTAIRREWGRRGNGEVHLFLRVPFPMAVLMGHLSNTLDAVVYEWGDKGYVPVARVKSGSGEGAVRLTLRAEGSS